jgi:lysozyme
MNKLIEMIKHHEGVVKHAYTDSRGYLTIGVGRLIDKELGGGLSDDEVDYLLANDLKRCQAEAETYGWFAGLNEPRQAVVISLLFNLGKPRWDKFKKAQAAIEAGDYGEAAAQMLDSRWADQVGKRADDMAGMMISGEWP